jgi:hypothetical protein
MVTKALRLKSSPFAEANISIDFKSIRDFCRIFFQFGEHFDVGLDQFKCQ